MQVRDIMTIDPVACAPDDQVATAAKIMVDRDCGAVPVVDSQETRRVVGILTDRDIVVRLVARRINPVTSSACDCMTCDVYVVRPGDSIQDVVSLMEEQQIRRVPVVEDGGVLVGIVATADLARKVDDEEMLAEVLEEVSEPELAGVA
ncbi:MAG: CBS domain-containing protein [Armatimonadetes bacterium]|nr:CBS domain-containing protein [Armatimonadota bacterium]